MKTQGFLAGAALLLGGCANGVGGLRPLSYQQPADTRLLVSYRRCPHQTGENLAPIIASAAMAAVSNVLTSFGTALAKGAEGGKLPASVAMANVELDRDKLPRCIIVIRGRFEDQGDGAGPIELVDAAEQGVVAGRPVKPLQVRSVGGSLVEADLPKTYALQHYVELALLSSTDNSATSFAPVFTRIERSMDGSRRGSRELSIELHFQRPGADPTGGAVLIGDRRIGARDSYRPVEPSGRYDHEAPWFAGAGVPAAADAPQAPAEDGGQAAGSATSQAPDQPHGSAAPASPSGGTNTADGAKGKGKQEEAGPFPQTITATVVESRPTREFLAFVASVFTATQPAIETAVKGQIDSAQRRSSATGDLDTQGAYYAALGTAHSAMTEYCRLSGEDAARGDRFAKSGSAAKAQLDANKAAIQALVRPLPFPAEQIIQVSGDPVDQANAAGCTGHA
jgi:hypothetical protein